MRLRVLGPLAASVVLTGSMSAPAAAACPNAHIEMPSRVSIDRHYRQVTIPLTAACGNDYVASDLYGPDGAEDIFIYDPAYDGARDYWDVYDWSLRPGRYYLRDGHAYDADYNQYGVDDDATVVKLGSYVGIATARTGSKVKVTVAARRYDASSERMIARPYAVVGLRERVPGTATWKVRTYVKTNGSGNATLTVSDPSPRVYQAWTGPTGSFWEAYSAQSTR